MVAEDPATPIEATLEPEAVALALTYGDPSQGASALTHCRISVKPQSDTEALITCAVSSLPSATAITAPIAAHLPLLPHLKTAWKTANANGILGNTPLNISVGDAGDFFEHHGWRIGLPPGSTLTWPVLPHDQYKKDGSATPDEGRIVVTLPLDAERKYVEVSVKILPSV